MELCSYRYHPCISMLNFRLLKRLSYNFSFFLFLSFKKLKIKQTNTQDLASSGKNNPGDKVQSKQAPDDGDRECAGQGWVWMTLQKLPSAPWLLAFPSFTQRRRTAITGFLTLQDDRTPCLGMLSMRFTLDPAVLQLGGKRHPHH